MLIGANNLNLDAKGRLAIPKQYRDQLEETCDSKLVVTVSVIRANRCLWVYPADKWEETVKTVMEMPNVDPQHQRVQQLLLGYANPVEIDKSGRVLIAPELREFAKLDKAVTLRGQVRKFELWDDEMWSQRCEQLLDDDVDPPMSPELGSVVL